MEQNKPKHELILQKKNLNTTLPYEHDNSTRSAQTQEHYRCYLLECHAAEGALDLLLSSITPHPEHLVRVPPLRRGAGSSRRLPLFSLERPELGPCHAHRTTRRDRRPPPPPERKPRNPLDLISGGEELRSRQPAAAGRRRGCAPCQRRSESR